MITKNIKEDYLFELCRTCDNLDKFKNAINQFERQINGTKFDENNNLILNNYSNAVYNLRDSDGRTLLHHCVANYTDQQLCFQYLIENYPQLILTPDYQGFTIIHLTVLEGNVKLLKFICTKGKNLIQEPIFRLLLQSSDNELHTALHWSVICQELKCLEILLDTIEKLSNTNDYSQNQNANDSIINMRDIHGATCLHYASMLSAKSKFFDSNEINRLERNQNNQQRKRSDSGMIDTSLSSNQKLENDNLSNERQRSAEKKLAIKILNKILHSKNVQVNCKDNDGRTPLLWSARLGESKAIKELLQIDSTDINAQDHEGRTAMHCAANKGDKSCIEILFKYGNANINAEDKNGAIPLHYAAKFGTVDACRSLLNYGSLIETLNFRGQNVVHCACSKGQYWICKTLVEEFDADLWKRDAKGELPLHYAVKSGSKELVKWILSLNPNAVNVGNNIGRTCLHLASQINNIQLCKLLIDYGASVNALMTQRQFTYVNTGRKEKFGISMVTPLDISLQRNHRNLSHFLIMNGAFPASKLGLNNILSKSNPNIYLDPDESKDSGESTFENDLIHNESTYPIRQPAQSPYSNSTQDEQLNYYKQSENRTNEKIKKQSMFPNQYSANILPSINRTIIDDVLLDADQKRSQSQPMFTERRSTSQNQFISKDNNSLDINQYALVQNSTGSSILDYSVDDLTKTQSIVTNVYLNCNHHSRRGVINPIRKRKMKLIKTFSSSQRNLNYDLNDLDDRNEFNNQFNSLGNLTKGDRDLVDDLLENADERKVNEQHNKKDNLINEVLIDEDKAQYDLTNSLSATELKNLKIDSESYQQSKDKSTRLNQLKEDTRKSSIKNQIKFDSKTDTDDKKNLSSEDISNKTDSKCSHYLHYKPDVNATKYNSDYSHIKHKVDTRNNIAYLKAQSNLLRSKSNLEDLAIDELDEAGEIMQNAEKSLRKYQIERKLLQELQDLKRYQIRTTQANEPAFVKRLAEQFKKQSKQPGMPEFCGPYTFKQYEAYLYNQLRKLSTSNEGKVPLPLLNIINMNVYDHQMPKTKLLKSKKLSKSTENTASKLNENDQQQIEQNKSKIETKKDDTHHKKESINMPIKITSLNAVKKTKTPEQEDQQKLRPSNDYAQTDENETLQDISTSFSEDKFDSLPEQMNSEVIRKQFHDAFKSMSIVNEETSDQDSSLNENKKTEIEKTQLAKEVETQKEKETKHILDKTEKSNVLEMDQSEIKESQQPSIKEKIQQVNQINQTLSALKNETTKDDNIIKETIEKDKSKTDTILDDKTNKLNDLNEKNNILIDENNNDLFKDYGEIIITNVHTLSAFNYTKKQEQTEMINKGWVLVDSIKEIDEKEEVSNKEEIKFNEKNGLSIKKEEKQNLEQNLKGQESIENLELHESKECNIEADKLIKQSSKDSIFEKKDSKEDNEQLLKDESIKKELDESMKIKQISKDKIKTTKQISKDSIIEEENNLEKKEDKVAKVDKIENQSSREQFDQFDRVEIGLLDQDNIKKNTKKSLSKSKDSKKSSSSSSSTTTSLDKESKIPKLSKYKLVKSSSSSTSSTPSKKSSTKSSTSSKKSSPVKKAKILTLQTTLEENVNVVGNQLLNESKDDEKNVKIDENKLNKIIIFDDDKIEINKLDESTIIKENGKIDTNSSNKEEILINKDDNQTNKTEKRRLSIVTFPTLPDSNSLSVQDGDEKRKKYAKTPIKQMSIDEKEDLMNKLIDEEISVLDDDSSPQSLNEDMTKEQIKKEKNELIENMDKIIREESFKQIEESVVRKLIDEEQKIINDEINLKSEKTELIKEIVKEEIITKEKENENKIKKDEKINKKEIVKNEKSNEIKKDESSKEKLLSTSIDDENKIDGEQAKVEKERSEIIFKKSSIEKEDLSERTAYIENMLRTSGYTEKIIEKANEFISSKDSQNKEDGVVEEVCLKLVKKNSKEYYNSKDQMKNMQKMNDQKQTDQGEEKSSNKTTDKKETQASKDQTSKSKKTESQTKTSAQSTSQLSSGASSQLKKSTSLSKIPTLQTTKLKKEDHHKSVDQTSTSNQEQTFRRTCLKPLQTKSEPLDQAVNRPVFKRKKSDLPPKYSIHLNSEQIKKKWNNIKNEEKDKLCHYQQGYYSHLRRTTSNPVISNTFDLIYEVNKMPSWASKATNQTKNKIDNSQQQKRSNTTSIITQTKRILEKVEKKEIEEVTTRTIINNEEEKLVKTSREESKTHHSETEETSQSIKGKECLICKKIIIPITEDMKFCKKDLRKMLSDSELQVKTCRC